MDTAQNAGVTDMIITPQAGMGPAAAQVTMVMNRVAPVAAATT